MSDHVYDPVPPESTLIEDPVFAWSDRDMIRIFFYGACFGVALVMIIWP